MSDENPYSAPSASLENSGVDKLTLTPQSRPAGNGIDWIKDGWTMLKQNMGLWIGMVLVMMILMILLSLIPLISLVAYVIGPMFAGGLMMGAHAQATEGKLEFNHLFAGFQHRAGSFAAIGGFYLLGLLIMVILMAIIGGLTGAGLGLLGGDIESGAGNAAMSGMMLVFVLIALALTIPLIMAYWFAPAIVALTDIGAFDAMKLSFRACLKNIVPFLLYGIVAFLLVIVGMIPFGLGMLIVGPLLTLSVYTSYRDIFGIEDA